MNFLRQDILKDLDKILLQYEKKYDSHDFKNFKDIIHKDAMYWFNDGSYRGIDQIGEAFTSTWDDIKDEIYRLNNIEWLCVDENIAVCIYQFTWSGYIDGRVASGNGRGTNVFINEEGNWKIIHEHLSRMPL